MLSCYMLLLFVFRLNCVHNLAVRTPKAFEESRVHQSDVVGQHLFQQSWGAMTLLSIFIVRTRRDSNYRPVISAGVADAAAAVVVINSWSTSSPEPEIRSRNLTAVPNCTEKKCPPRRPELNVLALPLLPHTHATPPLCTTPLFKLCVAV